MTFDAYGYSSMYLSGNMPVILLALILTLILTLLSAFKATCVYAMNKGSPGKGCIRDIFWLNSHTQWFINFGVRLLYEAYLISCMSCLISLRKDHQEHVVPELYT